jgi:regulator of nucleoside diphosphate kinase
MKERTNSRQIFITDFDVERLEVLIENANRRSSRDGKYLGELEQELTKAEVVTPAGIPPDVITMNSRVCLQDMDSGEDLVYTLVFPGDADVENGKISACPDRYSHDRVPDRRSNYLACARRSKKIEGKKNPLPT